MKSKKNKPTQLGQNIRMLRLARNLSQDDLANDLDICRNTLRSYEAGRTQPNVLLLQKIAVYFKTSVAKLIGN